MAKKRWPKAAAPLKPKYKEGDIVKKSSSGLIRFADKEGNPIGGSGGLGSDMIVYVIRAENHEYLVQVIPHLDLQSGTARMHKGAFGFIEAKHLSQGKREKAMTEAKVYDGKTFYEDRMHNARAAAGKREGRSYVDR